MYLRYLLSKKEPNLRLTWLRLTSLELIISTKRYDFSNLKKLFISKKVVVFDNSVRFEVDNR